MEKLSPEARKARNAYARKWRQNHPEKVREYARKQWERKAAEIKHDREKELTDELL